jgi:hypothetical protein
MTRRANGRTDPADGEPLPVHSFHTLLSPPSPAMSSASGVNRLTAILATPTGTQRRALDLLGVIPTAKTAPHHPLKMISVACDQKRAKFGLGGLGLVAYSSASDWRWLLAAIVLLANWPDTLFLIAPTNV